MANLTAFFPFNYETFNFYRGFETATFTPDPVTPSTRYYIEVDDNLTLTASGTGITYSGSNNTPASGTINAFQLDVTNTEGQVVAPVVSATGLNITYSKGISYLFKTPVQVAEDILKGKDLIVGSSGSDDLNGFGGNDTLKGNGGKDTFHFTEALSRNNVDSIRDFKGDKISLENSIFKGLTESNLKFTFRNIDGRDISEGKNDLDTNDRLLYDKGTGVLYYDKDGDGYNGADPVKFAVLSVVDGARPTIGPGSFDFE